MIFSQNIHPNKKWTNVDAMVYGEINGACILLKLQDDLDQPCTLAIHYGDGKNKNEFVSMFKEAISKLPHSCDACGQEIK